MQFKLRRLQRGSISGSNLPGDAIVAQAIGTICRDVEFEEEIVSVRLERLDSQAEVCEPRPELLRSFADLDELLNPLIADLHWVLTFLIPVPINFGVSDPLPPTAAVPLCKWD